VGLGLGERVAARGGLRGQPPIASGAGLVAALLDVYGQLGRQLGRALAEGPLELGADPQLHMLSATPGMPP
jgi:hypothetical protein